MNKYASICLLFLFLTMQSCIKDDLSHCGLKEQSFIWFKSINPKYNYAEIAQQVNLYLYDEQLQFAGELVYTQEELKQSQAKIYIPAEKKGAYTIIALVNLSDKYEIFDTERLVTWKGSLHRGTGYEDISYKLPDIYHSMKKISFHADQKQQEDTLYLVKNTNHIRLIVECSSQGKLDSIQPYIYGSNTMFSYENRLLGDRMVTYHPHTTTKQPGISEYSLTTMLLRTGGDASLYFKALNPDGSYTDRKLFNITERLANVKNNNDGKVYDTDQKLAYEDEFEFKVVLDNSSQIMHLIINDWYVIKDYVEIK